MLDLRSWYIVVLTIAVFVVGTAVFSFIKPDQNDLAIASFYPRSSCLLKSSEIPTEVFTQEKCEFQSSLAGFTLSQSRQVLSQTLLVDTLYLSIYGLFFLVYGLLQKTFNPWGILTLTCGMLAAACDFIENEGLRSLLSIPTLTPVWSWLKQLGDQLDPASMGLPNGMVALDLLQTTAVLKFFLIARAASSASTLLRGPRRRQLFAQGCLTISSFLMTFVCILNMFVPLQSIPWIRTLSMFGLGGGMILLLFGLL